MKVCVCVCVCESCVKVFPNQKQPLMQTKPTNAEKERKKETITILKVIEEKYYRSIESCESGKEKKNSGCRTSRIETICMLLAAGLRLVV